MEMRFCSAGQAAKSCSSKPRAGTPPTAPGVLPFRAWGKGCLVLCLQGAGPRGPAPDGAQPGPGTPARMSHCQRHHGPCPQSHRRHHLLIPGSPVSVCVPDTQGPLKSGVTSEWSGDSVVSAGPGPESGQGREGGPFSDHRPIRNAGWPLGLQSWQSCLLRARSNA